MTSFINFTSIVILINYFRRETLFSFSSLSPLIFKLLIWMSMCHTRIRLLGKDNCLLLYGGTGGSSRLNRPSERPRGSLYGKTDTRSGAYRNQRDYAILSFLPRTRRICVSMHEFYWRKIGQSTYHVCWKSTLSMIIHEGPFMNKISTPQTETHVTYYLNRKKKYLSPNTHNMVLKYLVNLLTTADLAQSLSDGRNHNIVCRLIYSFFFFFVSFGN